jgi:chromosome segregation and condensation protein ScpB
MSSCSATNLIVEPDKPGRPVAPYTLGVTEISGEFLDEFGVGSM